MREPAVARARARGVPVWGDIELFAQAVQAEGRPRILAITGTNGKTTVTAMTGALCPRGGARCLRCRQHRSAGAGRAHGARGRGDSARPLGARALQLPARDHVQPERRRRGRAEPDARITATATTAWPDYAAAKARIFHGTGIQIVNRDDPLQPRHGDSPSAASSRSGSASRERKGDWGIAERGARAWLAENGDRLLPVDELRVAGLHNAANALAALALCRAIDLPYALLADGLRAFRGLPHRLEHVAEIDGVVFFDDSKGTNVGATVAALTGIGRPAVLIAGGDGKGQDFAPLAPAVAAHARAVVLIGRDGPAHRARARRRRRSGADAHEPCRTRSSSRSGRRRRATRCCSRRRARASTCSATTSTGPRVFVAAVRALERQR